MKKFHTSIGYQHRDLASGRWQTFSLTKQLANIGSEVERAIRWRQKGNLPYAGIAIERALELLDLTLASHLTFAQLKELARVRECLVDDFYGENIYKSTPSAWQKYFYAFTVACRHEG